MEIQTETGRETPDTLSNNSYYIYYDLMHVRVCVSVSRERMLIDVTNVKGGDVHFVYSLGSTGMYDIPASSGSMVITW